MKKESRQLARAFNAIFNGVDPIQFRFISTIESTKEALNTSHVIYEGIKCRECESYGHVQAKCANTLKKNRSYIATEIDEES